MYLLESENPTAGDAFVKEAIFHILRLLYLCLWVGTALVPFAWVFYFRSIGIIVAECGEFLHLPQLLVILLFAAGISGYMCYTVLLLHHVCIIAMVTGTYGFYIALILRGKIK